MLAIVKTIPQDAYQYETERIFFFDENILGYRVSIDTMVSWNHFDHGLNDHRRFLGKVIEIIPDNGDTREAMVLSDYDEIIVYKNNTCDVISDVPYGKRIQI